MKLSWNIGEVNLLIVRFTFYDNNLLVAEDHYDLKVVINGVLFISMIQTITFSEKRINLRVHIPTTHMMVQE